MFDSLYNLHGISVINYMQTVMGACNPITWTTCR